MGKLLFGICSLIFGASVFCGGATAEPFPHDAGNGLGYRIRFAGSYKERENALVFSPITNDDIERLNGADDSVQKNNAFSFRLPNKPLKIIITDTSDESADPNESAPAR